MKEVKRLYAYLISGIVFAVALLAGSFSSNAMDLEPLATEVEATDDWLATSYRDGAYHIANANDLLAFAEASKSNTFTGEKVVLDNDIVYNDDYLTGYANWINGTEATNDFPRIGPNAYDANKAFKGTFDGQNYKVYGIYIKANYTADSSGYNCPGIFSLVNGTGSIQNVTFDYCYVETDVTAMRTGLVCAAINSSNANALKNVHAGQHTHLAHSNATGTAGVLTGGIAGQAWGTTIDGCSFDGEIICSGTAGKTAYVGGIVGGSTTGTDTIKNCSFGGRISVVSDYVGGIFGGQYNGAGTTNIESCISSGYITSTAKSVGGIYGGTNIDNHKVNIKKCKFTGEVTTTTERIGGIYGAGDKKATVTVEQTVSSGKVSATGSGSLFAGGFFGWIPSGCTVTVNHCLFDGDVTTARVGGANCIGGIVGTNAGATVKISDTFVAGSIHANGQTGQIASIVGQCNPGSVTITNTYAVYGAATYNTTTILPLVGQLAGGAAQTVTNSAQIFKDYTTGAKAYQACGGLDTAYWVFANGKKPQLKIFTDDSNVSFDNLRRADYSWYHPSNGSSAGSIVGNAGTLSDIYDFYGFAYLSKAISFSGITITLDADITDNATGAAKDWETTAPAYVFPMIGGDGNDYVQFQGKFNGGGHTISGIYVHGEIQGVGLFTQMNSYGEIYNFTLENSFIGQFADSQSLGGIVGRIRNSASAEHKAVHDVTIGANTVISRTVGTQLGTGGIAGQAWATTIDKCVVLGTINARTNSPCVGGILGWTSVNDSAVNITGCTFNGTMNTTPVAYGVGGIFGGHRSAGSGETVTIDGCKSYGTINGSGRFGGIAGASTFDGAIVIIKNCESKATLNGTGNYVGGIVAEAVNKVSITIENTTFNGTITINGQGASGFIGAIYNTADASIVIKNCKVLSDAVIQGSHNNAGFIGNIGVKVDKCELEGLYMHGTIKGTNVSASQNGGIIGNAGTNSTNVNNISLTNVYCDGTIQFLGSGNGQSTGGLIGIVPNYAVVTLTCCEFAGEVSHVANTNTEMVGGFIGQVAGEAHFTDCLFTGNVTIVGSAKDAFANVAGFVGMANGATSKLYLTRCVSAGEVHATGNNAVGSIVGNITGAAVFDKVYVNDKIYISSSMTKATESKGVGVPGSAGKVTGNTVLLGTSFGISEALGLDPVVLESAWYMDENGIPALYEFAAYTQKEIFKGNVTILTYSRLKKGTNTSFATITGGGLKNAYDLVTITAQAKSGYTFLGWYLTENGTGVCLGTDLSISGTALDFGTDEFTLYALYDFGSDTQVPFELKASDFALYIGEEEPIFDSEFSGNIAPGTTITVVYSGNNTFYAWLNESGRVISKEECYEFTIYNGMKITAQEGGETGESVVTFLSEFNQVLGSGVYADATAIEFPTIPATLGKEFVGYKVNGQLIATEGATRDRINELIGEGTDFITVSHCFEATDDRYVITVESRYVANLSSLEEYSVLDSTQLPEVAKAGIANVNVPLIMNEDKAFCYFMDSQGTILSYTNAMRYRTSEAEVTLYAIYSDSAVTTKPEVHITVAEVLPQGGSKDTFVISATRAIPEDYTLVEQGILIYHGEGDVYADAVAHLYKGDEECGSYISTGKEASDVTTLNIKNVPYDLSVYVKAYVIVRDSSNVQKVYYSTIAYGTHEGLVIE